MASAIRFDQLIQDGIVEDQGEIACLGHVTPARLSQIMGMLSLAPEIQEAILFLTRVDKGCDRVTERDLRRVMRSLDWGVQRADWKTPERWLAKTITLKSPVVAVIPIMPTASAGKFLFNDRNDSDCQARNYDQVATTQIPRR